MRYVYIIRNLTNGKVYVGQTKNPKGRKATHWCIGRKAKSKYPLYRSMQKHGLENFSFEVLEECADELIDEQEKFWVAHFDSFNPEKGYNLTLGGEGVVDFYHTEETKKRISLWAKTRTGVLHSQFGKQNSKLSQRNKEKTGCSNPMFGRRGTSSPIAKLTIEQIHEIVSLPSTLKNAEIAQRFNVSRVTIWRIRNNKSSYLSRSV